MTNKQLEERFAYLVRSERRITREILELICEVERRQLHVEQAYPTMFEWLVKKWGYSQPAAYRRIQAARLMRDAPQIKEKLVSGELNLTTVSQVQTVINREERRIREKVSVDVKHSLLAQVEGKSCEETDKVLKLVFPVAVIKTDVLRPAGQDHSKLMVVIEDQDAEALQRARELLSHTCQTWSEVVAWLVRDYLKRKDPLQKR